MGDVKERLTHIDERLTHIDDQLETILTFLKPS